MPGFFDALKNFKSKERKPHTVTVEGQSMVVSLERKLEIMKVGEENYVWQKGEIVRKKITPKEQQQTILTKANKGYTFHKKDPFWVENINEEGYIWQIK